MSDTYKIGTVTVVALGGGWYELHHDSLSEPKKVHGKDAAEAEAAKIGAEPEGHMQQQGSLDDDVDVTAVTTLEDPRIAALEAKNAQLEAEASEFRKRFEDFMKGAAPGVRTVVVDDEVAAEAVPAQAPRTYSGQMDPKTRAMFKKAGIEVRTIVLEENESIPPTGLFIGHNGRSYMISPGEEVDVPDFLLSVLDDAVMSAPVVDAKSRKVLGYRSRSKYPYRDVTKR